MRVSATYIRDKTTYMNALCFRDYNMVCSALFLQCALYTVHCTHIMHSRKPSFVITTTVFSWYWKSLCFNIHGNEIRHILLKQFHLITLHIATVKHPWFNPWTWRNGVMFERRSADFKTISVTFVRAGSKVLCVAIGTSWRWMALWRHYWRRQWLGGVHCSDWASDLCMRCPPYFVLFS